MALLASPHRSNTQHGRSMIEMLGVLSIVGILSIAGISELGKILSRHKTMKTIETFTQLVQDVLIQKRAFRTIPEGYTSQMSLAISEAGLLPSGWEYKNQKLYNNMGYAMFYNKNNQIQINYTMTGKNAILSGSNKELCRMFFTNFAVPFETSIKSVAVFQGSKNIGYWYGDNYCTQTQNCLKNITIPDIEKQCSICAKNEDYGCAFVIFFPFD